VCRARKDQRVDVRVTRINAGQPIRSAGRAGSSHSRVDRAAAKKQSRRIDIGHQCLSTSDASEIERLRQLTNCQTGLVLNEVRLKKESIGGVEDQEYKDHDDAKARLRGPCGAHDEFLLTATVQNLRKLATLNGAAVPRVRGFVESDFDLERVGEYPVRGINAPIELFAYRG
jgi:hypothetical protein